MEIHAPEHPIHTFKDFAVHIAVVTCGILIALGLEGVRETIHEHHLVRETRESIRLEMGVNFDHGNDELQRVTLYRDDLKSLIADLPTLAQQHPEQIATRLAAVRNPFYFFSANSWQSGLSTGAFAHMSTDEVSAYSYAAEIIRNYAAIQKIAEAQDDSTMAYFAAHPRLTPDQLETATEKLILFYKAEDALAHVCPQMQRQVASAERAASGH